eukprot:EG_transcript_3518
MEVDLRSLFSNVDIDSVLSGIDMQSMFTDMHAMLDHLNVQRMHSVLPALHVNMEAMQARFAGLNMDAVHSVLPNINMEAMQSVLKRSALNVPSMQAMLPAINVQSVFTAIDMEAQPLVSAAGGAASRAWFFGTAGLAFVCGAYLSMVVETGHHSPGHAVMLSSLPGVGLRSLAPLAGSGVGRAADEAETAAHGQPTAIAAMSASGEAVASIPRAMPNANDDNNVLRRAILGALGVLAMISSAVLSFARFVQGQPVTAIGPASTAVLQPIAPTAARPSPFPTVMPAAARDVPGVYHHPASKIAPRVLKAVSALSTWEEWYEAPLWARNGHVHTIVACTTRHTPPVRYYRTMLRCPKGGTIALDLLAGLDANKNDEEATYDGPPPAEWVEQNRTKPFLLMVSGVSGGSHDGYIRSLAIAAQQRGWQVGVVNMRGCAHSPITSPRFFTAHTGSTDDVRLAVRHIREQLLGPGGRLVAVGWSNGGTIINNVLGEQGTTYTDSSYRIDAAATLACPLRMVVAAENFKKWFNRYVYDRMVALSLLDMLAPALPLFDGQAIDTLDGKKCTIDVKKLMQCDTIAGIDDVLTCKILGFPSVQEYYRHASSHQRLKDIPVPTLIVNALDDPMAPGAGIAYEEAVSNPNLMLAVTEHGGHLGWCDKQPAGEGPKWIERVCLDFFDAIAAP